MLLDGTKDSKPSKRTEGLLEKGMKGLSKECTQVKSDRERQIPYDTLICGNLKKKKDTNELIYKREEDLET